MTIPTATELVERYGEPDDISGDTTGSDNMDRVHWAHASLEPFHLSTMHAPVPGLHDEWEGTDAESALGDLIADLLHLATFVGLDTDQVWERGWSHFAAEVGRGYEPTKETADG